MKYDLGNVERQGQLRFLVSEFPKLLEWSVSAYWDGVGRYKEGCTINDIKSNLTCSFLSIDKF